MYGETHQDSEEIPAKLLELLRHVLHLQHLLSHQETHSNGGQVDDPGSDLHHDNTQTLKESQQRHTILTTGSNGNTSHNTEHYQTQQVGAGGPISLKIPGVLVIRIYCKISFWISDLQ